MSKNRSQSGSVQEPTKRKVIKRLRFIVSQKEIDDAQRGKSRKCMIHQSLQRDFPNFRNVLVDKNHVRFTDPEQNLIYTFQMSPVGRIAILKWDAGETVPPFEVKLYNGIARKRILRGGYHRPKGSQDSAKKHLGPVPTPKTKEARRQSGRDRVFGEKLWAVELATARKLFTEK